MDVKQEIFNLLDGKVHFYNSDYNPTSDSVYLANFAPSKKTVLDVGVGTGGVSLCYLEKSPNSIITGIDNSLDRLEICKKNASLNNRNIELIHENFLSWKTDRCFDLVITNPPYFSGTASKHNAHHNIDLSKWTQYCIKRVKPRGLFCCILDPFFLNKVLFSIPNSFGELKIVPIFSKKNTAERVLISARLGISGGSSVYRGMDTEISNNKTKK